MLNRIKNILFVSYLKNKGIRRICFILGCALLLYFVFISPGVYNKMVIDREYLNIDHVKSWSDVYYDTDVVKYISLIECTDEHFQKIGIKGVKYALYGKGLSPVKEYCSVNSKKDCERFTVFATDKIDLNCGKRSFWGSRLFGMIIFFYFPFLLIVILKAVYSIVLWVYKGFKQK